MKSRVADMEGQTRPSAGVTLLENKIQELEERLRSEERYAMISIMGIPMCQQHLKIEYKSKINCRSDPVFSEFLDIERRPASRPLRDESRGN